MKYLRSHIYDFRMHDIILNYNFYLTYLNLH